MVSHIGGENSPGRSSGQSRPGGRFRSLDGLRGWAAAVVVLSHVALTFPVLADVVYGNVAPNEVGTLDGIVSFTPAHIFWAGQEAVFLFFILSGFVLALPVLRAGKAYSWRAYYPRRVVRIYGPVAFAVLFGIATVILVSRHEANLGAWLDDRPKVPTVTGVIRDLTLVFGGSRLISPLWSLQWEVLFSLLLPIYIALTRVKPNLAWLKIALLLIAMCFGVWASVPALVYLPMFAFGTLAAYHQSSISSFAARLSDWFWSLLVVLSICLICSRWLGSWILDSEAVADASVLPTFAGCALLVLACAYWRAPARALERPVSQWLGRISFSLYLIHEPIVIAAAFAIGPTSFWLAAAVSVPLSVLASWTFYHLVEARFHHLAKRIGAVWNNRQ